MIKTRVFAVLVAAGAVLATTAAPAVALPGDVVLKNGKPLDMDPPPAAGTGHSIDLTTVPIPPRRWGVVAIQPTTGRDVDLDLYADGTGGARVAFSYLGTSQPDFVAFDEAISQPLQYHAVVSPYGTSAPYRITWTSATTTTAVDWTAYQFGNNENVHVHDLAPAAGQCVGVGVWGTTHNTGAAYVFANNPSGAGTIVTPTSAAVGKATYHPGMFTDYYDAAFTYFRANGGRYGVILVNQHDSSDGNPAQYEIVPASDGFCG